GSAAPGRGGRGLPAAAVRARDLPRLPAVLLRARLVRPRDPLAEMGLLRRDRVAGRARARAVPGPPRALEAPRVVTVHVGIATGGTFTDFLVVCEGRSFVFKVPSTPDDPSRAFHEGLAIAARRLLALGVDVAATRPWDVAHGFTVATNALLARRGA